MRSRSLIKIFLVTLLLIPGTLWAGEARIKSEIADRLLASTPWDKGAAVVRGIRLSGFDPEKDTYDRLTVTLPRGMKNRGKVTAYITLYKDGRKTKNLWATAWIKVYKEVVVAMGPLKMKRRIMPADVKLVRTELSATADASTSLDSVIGMVVKRPVGAGDVIKNAYLRPRRLIKRGDRVQISVENDRFKVRTSGVAVEDGHEGALVTARTASGRKVIGRVAGPGRLTVEF